MWPFKKKENTARIHELEITLRILSASLLVKSNRPSGLHARDNKLLSQYVRTVDELEKLSAEWRKKDILNRRSKK